MLKYLLLTILLISLDCYFYYQDNSWTMIHYESFVPLLGIGSQSKKIFLSAIFWTILSIIVMILFFQFHIDVKAASASIFGILTIYFLLLSSTLLYSYSLIKKPYLPTAFLIFLSASIMYDKSENEFFSSFFMPHFFKITTIPETNSQNIIYKSAKKAIDNNNGVVLIVFESLGIPLNDSPLNRLREKYTNVKFTEMTHEGGSTTSAEVRYLCGKNGDISDYSKTECLPKTISSSIALHGNSLSYFNRYKSYKEYGFTEILGKEELPNLKRCEYSYSAICDQDLIEETIRLSNNTDCNGITYALTIDSHYSYSKYQDHVSGLYNDIDILLEKLSRLKSKHPSCKILIAGDHPPPMSNLFKKSILAIEL